ncbi:VOC family protein [Streptomyces sp. NPDC002004]
MDNDTTAAGTGSALTSDAVFGAPCWVSLVARDLPAAQDFYGGVLGWKFHDGGLLGGDVCVAFSEGVPVAGMGTPTSTRQAVVAWTPYFAVSDIDATAARIRERSGTVAVGPLTFPAGRAALVADRDGATFGVWQGELFAGWESWRTQAPAWVRLRTRDAFEAAIFYGEVLEWAGSRCGCCEVGYEADEVVLRSGGHVVARLYSGALEDAADPTVRPRWQIHFPVADVGRCVEATGEHGGWVIERTTTSDSDEAILRDPDGALFAVNSTNE